MTRKVAIVPTVLEEKLFGTAIQYTDNYIQLDAETNTGSFLGTLAQPYAYKPELRGRLNELVNIVRNSNTTNRYFVLEGLVCRAAQSSIEGAIHYMDATRVLVAVL
jgi:hypothetical protein